MEDKDNQTEIQGGADEDYYGVAASDKDPVFVPGCYEEEEEEEILVDAQNCLLLRKLATLWFPDNQVLIWFCINAAIILVYAVFNLNAHTIVIDNKLNATDYTTNAIWAMSFIFVGNVAIHLCAMLARFLLVKGVLEFLCARNAYLFALLNMLDPSIFYVAWASLQSVVWQILIIRVKTDTKFFRIEAPFWPSISSKYLTFNDEALVWISCTIYIYIILSLRCISLSVISFTFELNLLVNSNEALKKYLKLYTNIRKFNIDWLSFVMSKPELVNKLKTAFSKPRLRGKLFPSVVGDSGKIVDSKSKYALQILNESHDTTYMQHFSANEDISVPSYITDALVEQSSASAFSNWLLIYYVIRVPPVVSLLHQEIVLKEDGVVPDAAALLFEHMYVTLTRLPQQQEGLEIARDPLTNSTIALSARTITLTGSDAASPRAVTDTASDAPDAERPSATHLAPSMPDAADAAASATSAAAAPRSAKPPRKPSQETPPHSGRGSHHSGCVNVKGRPGNHRAISMMHLQNFRNTIVEDGDDVELALADASHFVTPDYQFNLSKGDDPRFLSTEQMRHFLMAEESDTIMSLLDLSGHGRINLSMLQQALLNLHATRKKFKNNIKGQDSIFKVLSRLLSVASWLLAIVTVAFLAGITAEAIVVSGAALLSAITVALSYLYTNFMTSVIFVAFSNPYNVGDRVRLNDGEPLTVKKIRTYTTEFVSILGKVMVYQNALLSTMKITNESRAARATIEIVFKVDTKTSEEDIHGIQEHVVATCNARPNDFVKDSVWLFLAEFNPGYCYVVSIWVTCIESWANWQRIFQLKGEIMEQIMRQCKKKGIGYSLPVQPMSFPQQLSIRNVRKKELPPPGKRP